MKNKPTLDKLLADRFNEIGVPHDFLNGMVDGKRDKLLYASIGWFFDGSLVMVWDSRRDVLSFREWKKPKKKKK